MWPALGVSTSGLLKHVAEPAARSLVLACFAALAATAFRVRGVSCKVAIWRGVLIAALAMPLLGSFLPPVGLPLPLLKFGPRAPVVQQAETRSVVLEMPVANSSDGEARPNSVNVIHLQGASAFARRDAGRSIPWLPILAGIYLGLAFVLLARMFVGAAFGNRLVRRAIPVSDAAALRLLSALARKARLKVQPLLAESEALVVPLTVRVRKPALLLPASWREWDAAKLRAVLAHELSHVARRDALVQRLALIHRAIFWFSPLGWWLVRHLDDLAEQASDQAALACGMERTEYAETLLGFIAAMENCGSRAWWQGLAMAKRGRAEKRLDRILAWRNVMPNNLRKSFLVGLALLAAPVVALTASVHPRFVNAAQSTAAPSPEPPPSAAAAPTPGIQAVVNPGPAPVIPRSAPGLPVLPAAAPVAAARPAAPPAAVQQATSAAPAAPVTARAGAAAPAKAPTAPATATPAIAAPSGATVYGPNGAVAYDDTYRYGDNGPRFVIITAGSDSVIMSGSTEDEEHAKALESKIPGDFIWFERDEKSYVIRDQATVQRAKQLWQRVEDLGRQQADLGQQQALLGQTEANIGRQMDQVRVKIPDLSTQMEKLAAEMKQLSASGGTVEQVGDLQARIGELQSQLGEVESEAGRRQAEIGRRQAEMGRKQAVLGRQQGELGRQQAELSRAASQQMKRLLDDAMAHGLAKPE